MLDNAQILNLVEKAQQGDQDAKEVLLKENAPLIRCVIKRFKDGKMVSKNVGVMQKNDCLNLFK